jgi:hypothetical protein
VSLTGSQDHRLILLPQLLSCSLLFLYDLVWHVLQIHISIRTTWFPVGMRSSASASLCLLLDRVVIPSSSPPSDSTCPCRWVIVVGVVARCGHIVENPRRFVAAQESRVCTVSVRCEFDVSICLLFWLFLLGRLSHSFSSTPARVGVFLLHYLSKLKVAVVLSRVLSLILPSVLSAVVHFRLGS